MRRGFDGQRISKLSLEFFKDTPVLAYQHFVRGGEAAPGSVTVRRGSGQWNTIQGVDRRVFRDGHHVATGSDAALGTVSFNVFFKHVSSFFDC